MDAAAHKTAAPRRGPVHPLGAAVYSRPPAPLDHDLRAELERLAHDVEHACPTHRMSRRAVRLDAHLPLALRWYWEIFGYSDLSQRCVAPDDPSARESALDVVHEWALDDARYVELAARLHDRYEVLAFDDDEVVVMERATMRRDDDPPVAVLRAPSGSSEVPEFEALSASALRYLVAGALKGLWVEQVRVLLSARPPVETEAPYPRVAPHVGRGLVQGATVWVAERLVHNRPGFAMYFDPADAEAIDAWLVREGLGDHMLV